ncbi:MAG: vanadium-dependent haloperoxidase [Gemmatimonadaceae bacterium]
MRNISRTSLVITGLALAACARPAVPPATQSADAKPLHDAVHQLTSVIVYDIFSPPQASRVYAYASVAAYETLRQGDTSYHSLAGQLHGLKPLPALPADGEVSLPLAGVHAFMTVSRALTFSRARMDSLRVAMDERFKATGIPTATYQRSIAYGDTVAARVLAWAATDRFKESRGMPKYSVTRDEGRWIPTPPAYMDAVEPNWYTLRPFVLDTSAQFRPAAPLPFNLSKSSPFFKQAMEVYTTGKGLTEEQRAIAAFWDCNPYVMHVQGHTMFATKKITPGGHWMGIVAIASQQVHADMLRSAEAYARTAIALADGFISVWEAKYWTNYIRPETVINQHIDDQWLPLLQTPPFPEYTSGHSVISTAAARVLTDVFGDNFAFTDSSEMEYGLPTRAFPSFNAAANEAAISRLYGGIHFRQAIEEGQKEGAKVGALVVERVHTRPAKSVTASTSTATAPAANGQH